MVVEIKGKKIRVPDKEIKHSMDTLKISTKEAVQMWLEDEGYLDNDKQKALEQKAKDNRITATIHQAQAKDIREKKTPKQRAQRENPTKEMIIAEIAKILPNFAEKVVISNKTKYIDFKIGDESFTIDLIRHTKKVNGR